MNLYFSPADEGEETLLLLGYSLSQAVVLVRRIKRILVANLHYLLDEGGGGAESSAASDLHAAPVKSRQQEVAHTGLA